MAEQENNNQYQLRRRYSQTLEGIAGTVEWLLLAMILALVFRAFAVEAFQIPTGSMAETLRGAHYHFRCPRCGYLYDMGADTSPMSRPKCPGCGYSQPPGTTGRLQNGDRIFVLKCIYQFFQPKRWDVVVFKNPLNPKENYIKRLIALPGETVAIKNGDIHINGKIARKPLRVQQELWMCVYDNDYQPFGSQRRFAGEITARIDRENQIRAQPFENENDSAWNLSAEGPTVFALDRQDGQIHTILYNSQKGNDFTADYAYNANRGQRSGPVCGDVMVSFFVEHTKDDGQIGAAIVKNGVGYIGRLEFGGTITLEKTENGKTAELRKMEIDPPRPGQNTEFSFAEVDRRLVLRVGKDRLSADLADSDADNPKDRRPVVKIFGAGKMKLRHIGLYRDTYYISDGAERATAENPFTLAADEFFVCGDNSPNSADGRMWLSRGYGNNGAGYRPGTVPRDFMMGKAFFVYWSQAYSPAANMAPVIPNIDQCRLIAGGCEQAY